MSIKAFVVSNDVKSFKGIYSIVNKYYFEIIDDNRNLSLILFLSTLGRFKPKSNNNKTGKVKDIVLG